MFKVISIILSVVILAVSCSKSCKEEEKKEKVEQQQQQIEKEKIVEKEKEEIKKEKIEEKQPKEEKKDLISYLDGKYPWVIEKHKELKELYLKSIGELKNLYWIRNLDVVAPENKSLTIDDKKYVFITFCKPHDCGDNNVVLLFDPEKKEFFGYYILGNKKIKIGKVDKSKEKLLKIALNEFGEGTLLRKLENNKLVSAESVIEKKLEKCPPIYKSITLRPSTAMNLDPKIYKLILKAVKKELELSEEDLKNIKEEDIYVAFADLNDDGKEDIIFSITGILFCGTAGCSTYALINKGNGKYKIIDLGLTEDNTILLTNKKIKGFRIIIKNQHLMLIYNGKAYRLGGECYVK